MIILGIDPGTAKLGYGVIKIGNKKLLEKIASGEGKNLFSEDITFEDLLDKLKVDLIRTDVFITPAEMEMPKRLKLLFQNINELIEKHTPHVMAIEKIFFNTNAKTAISVGQARGISLLSASYTDMKIFEYTALQAKLVITGYGRSDKKQMQEAVMKHLKLVSKVKSDDANDAVAMALCFLQKDLNNYLSLV